MTNPKLPNADELEVVALLKERDGQTFDGEIHLSSAEAAAIIAQIERLTRERDDYLRRAEEQFTGWIREEVARKAAEAEVKRLREATNQCRLAFSGMVSVQSAIDLLDSTALSGGTSNG